MGRDLAAAFENWRRCRAEGRAQAEAWVFGIARHQLAAYYRSGAIRKRALERLSWSVLPVDAALDEELERMERIVDRDALRRAFADALDTLPPMRRRAARPRLTRRL